MVQLSVLHAMETNDRDSLRTHRELHPSCAQLAKAKADREALVKYRDVVSKWAEEQLADLSATKGSKPKARFLFLQP